MGSSHHGPHRPRRFSCFFLSSWSPARQRPRMISPGWWISVAAARCIWSAAAPALQSWSWFRDSKGLPGIGTSPRRQCLRSSQRSASSHECGAPTIALERRSARSRAAATRCRGGPPQRTRSPTFTALLKAAGEARPYVLVGHSYGGLVVGLYASVHPEEVSGLVLIDALSERLQDAETPEQWKIQRRLMEGDIRESLALYPLWRGTTRIAALHRSVPLSDCVRCLWVSCRQTGRGGHRFRR